MARPKLDPNAPSLPKTPQEAMEQGYFTVDDIDVNNADDPTLTALMERATAFLMDKREILGKIGKARTIGHGLLETGIGSRSQAEFFRFYLPQKTRNKNVEVDEDDDMEDTDETTE